MFKNILLSVCLLGGMGAGYDYSSKKRINEENEGLLQQFRDVSDKLDTYIQRDKRISYMEKTLIIHYNLSWYEAHYYSIIFDDFSQKYDVPWQIYPAVIRIESNFDPTIKSPKNAKGITQVIEPTAKEVAKKLGIEYKSITLWNDLLNMVIGLTYLSEGIKEVGLEDGIRRYIGGPGFDKGRKDIGEYRTTVRWEYERLSYIYRGVLNSPDTLIAMIGD